MAKQPEQILKEQLVDQLQTLNCSLVHFNDEKELLANHKNHLGRKHSVNPVLFSRNISIPLLVLLRTIQRTSTGSGDGTVPVLDQTFIAMQHHRNL